MSTQMTAFLKQSRKKGDIALRQVPLPMPGPGQVLIRTEAVGLCGSDIHAVNSHAGYEWLPERVVLGHEAVGIIHAVGPDVSSTRIGERVVPLAIDGCLNCSVCAGGTPQLCSQRDCLGLSFDGALADFFVLDAGRTVTIDNELSSSMAALVEPTGVAVHAVRQLGENLQGQRIIVSGPGPVGLLCGLFAEELGADVELVGPLEGSQTRLDFASQLGFATVRGHEGIEGTRNGRPIDAWIEASGAAVVLETAITLVRRGGTIVIPGLFGVLPHLDVNQLVRSEARLQGTYGYTRGDYGAATELLLGNQERLASMVTEFPMESVLAAVEATEQTTVIKAVVVADWTTTRRRL
ncbi:alcohol dehydrogenase catalytic domain-containing protein [Pseudarthrobacter sp. RMG13]|uniref:Alcohol dehydrogenase catalytic domain-containing protein n=1 Tax=Pseudarthrobacter humi TaxID=2952523 RepID=A0ABT1LUA6_9MICC|nr:alcohol dehydrogenase catalytic domain-containing protein [Pseudarthrobacter humi]MCP9002057.1 alcohol dehydrogenase catalytic domain-containing protein [Pseudarthrobacter humi]